MKKNVLLVILFLNAAAVMLFAGGNSESSAAHTVLKDGEMLRIVATTNIIADVVQNIAGDRAEVTGLIPAGQDPHGYEPGPKQVGAVEKAHIVFVNGFDLEEQILDIVENTAQGMIVEVSSGVDPLTHEEADAVESGHDHEGADPHTWMSLRNVKIWAVNIEKALSAADPANSVYYKSRAEKYASELDSLETQVTAEFNSILPERRLIITDHEVFGYLARDYGFTIIGTIFPSLSTNSEASAKHLGDLADLLKSRDVNAIFIGESSGDAVNKLADALSEESGRKVKIISILTGSLSKKGTEGDTYLGFFRYNAEKITEGLKTE